MIIVGHFSDNINNNVNDKCRHFGDNIDNDRC